MNKIVEIGLTYLISDTKENEIKADKIYVKFKKEIEKEFPKAKILSVYLHQTLKNK